MSMICVNLLVFVTHQEISTTNNIEELIKDFPFPLTEKSYRQIQQWLKTKDVS